MSELLTKQQKFARAVASLIIHAEHLGTPVTFGDAYRDPRAHGAMGVKGGYGSANSCHKLRLAVDLNIVQNGKLAPTKAYAKLHDYWDDLGGSKRIENDMNHFSFEHNGYR
jgi:hypothetical protein